MNTDNLFNSGILYAPREIEQIEQNMFNGEYHVPTEAEWQEYGDKLRAAYKEKYCKEFRGWSCTEYEQMAEISPVIKGINERARDNQYPKECLVRDRADIVYNVYYLSFSEIQFGTAKVIGFKNN